MAHVSDLIATDIEQYLKSHEKKSLLRFITCGSVDDGKSTLIGRLLYESKMLFEDQLAAVVADSRKFGTQGDAIDFALLVDGLAAEREQGITIDVAYRFFSTDKRKFIVADTPGHEQYTRNMVTGASTADVAILMVDARKGILTQTRRHSYLTSLIGIRHIVVAINKMDLVDYSEKTYRRIVEDFEAFARQIGLSDVTFIPLSAFKGDNIVEPSDRMPWFHGTTLMGYLETVEVDEARQQKTPFRMPVQWVNRPNLDFRGFAGQIGAGAVKPGDAIRVLPSGKTTTVKSIVTFDGDLEQAVAGQSVTLTFADEIDCSRGDVIAAMAGMTGRTTDDAGALRHDPSLEYTGGGLALTPRALARFYWKLARGEIISPASFAQMTASTLPVVKTAEVTSVYGLGVFVNERAGFGRYISHSGFFPGFTSNVGYFLDHGFAAEMGNRRNEAGAVLADSRTAAFFAEHLS